jgi:hypothetical protein
MTVARRLRRLPAAAILSLKLTTVVFGLVIGGAIVGDACLLAEGYMTVSQFLFTQLIRLTASAFGYVVTLAVLGIMAARRRRRCTYRATLVSAVPPWTPRTTGPTRQPGVRLEAASDRAAE